MIVIKRKEENLPDLKGFHCDCCGACCRLFNKGIYPKEVCDELDRGDGVCKYLDENTNLCTIYDNRPDICSVKKVYYKYFKDKMTPEEYVKKTTETCKLFKEVMK